MLSRLIVEIANHPLLGGELVFRGGTCLHKLHLPTPRRYSEDLDYVRVTSSPIGPLLDALREVGDLLDLEARTQVSQHPKGPVP
ncbi:MAG: nucleotidyl transferase AbiEii/AbiGii toxin family protein [Microthrixaceae bacterium]|nr:nucleotidyl transferase AbiEii/AbiGii toxin family protein [Microthrixaceae bacterium]